MNRFFRTAYATTFVYLCLTLSGVLISGAGMPFPAFSFLYFGLLMCLLPGVSPKLAGKERLFYGLGALTALLGFLPIALWHCPPIHWFIHLLGIAAAAVFLSVLRHRTTHGIFMAKYEFSVILLLVVIGMVCLGMVTFIYGDGQASERAALLKLALSNIVPYAVVLLASGVLLLRGLRAQPGMDEQTFNRRQLRDTLIFAVIVTLVFAVDPFVYLKQAVYFLVTEVLRPGARGLVQLLSLLVKVLSRPKQPSEETMPIEETMEDGQIPVLEPAEADTEHFHFTGDDLTRAIAYVCVAAAALALLCFLAVQIRKMIRNLLERSRNRGSGYPNETREALPPEEGSKRKKKPKKRSSDPRERMRWLYGEFLRHLNKLRVRFAGSNTCGEIERRAEENAAAGPETLSGLTALYEEARYRLEDAPTEADVQAMKEFVDKVKKRA